jgi:hypothetical protein
MSPNAREAQGNRLADPGGSACHDGYSVVQADVADAQVHVILLEEDASNAGDTGRVR